MGWDRMDGRRGATIRLHASGFFFRFPPVVFPASVTVTGVVEVIAE